MLYFVWNKLLLKTLPSLHRLANDDSWVQKLRNITLSLNTTRGQLVNWNAYYAILGAVLAPIGTKWAYVGKIILHFDNGLQV